MILSLSALIPLTVWLASDDKEYTQNSDFAVYQIAWLIFRSLAIGIAINQICILVVTEDGVDKELSLIHI
ncbi:hypothetical protein [uncultured Paraglaciecola sp.]|uniref:hypothetical protein n=1 Tax=uncultured Paraglaciecola sp. TaxID=1765024 RepID=UPI0025F2E248|nr:hypothetical protein [uncultured Paraglaciecola sp.]